MTVITQYDPRSQLELGLPMAYIAYVGEYPPTLTRRQWLLIY